ncbi:hypothetical protein EON64_05825 [archaeon]|nr:MAG: hypothetical protein EON64_05825 [archaeon]
MYHSPTSSQLQRYNKRRNSSMTLSLFLIRVQAWLPSTLITAAKLSPPKASNIGISKADDVARSCSSRMFNKI